MLCHSVKCLLNKGKKHRFVLSNQGDFDYIPNNQKKNISSPCSEDLRLKMRRWSFAGVRGLRDNFKPQFAPQQLKQGLIQA